MGQQTQANNAAKSVTLTISGSVDPTVGAGVNAVKGTLYIRKDTAEIYQKDDDGLSVNWTKNAANAGAAALTSINDQLANSTRQGNIGANDASGVGSFAGNGTIAPTTASGIDSHAEGRGTIAAGTQSHAEGNQSVTTAPASSAHAEGQLTTASGAQSHAEGNQTIAAGADSHAEGLSTQANGAQSHAEGKTTQSLGVASHAEGDGCVANGLGAHAEGQSAQALADFAHAEGESTIVSGIGAHGEGTGTQATGTNSHVEGKSSLAEGLASHASGFFSKARDDSQYSHASDDLGVMGSGNAQYSRHHLTQVLNDAAGAGELFIGSQNAPKRVTMDDETVYMCRLQVSAIQTSGAGDGDTAGWDFTFLAKRIGGGALAIVGGGAVTAPVYSDAGAATWRVNAANNVNDLALILTGFTVNETIHVSATLQLTEAKG